MTTLEKLHWIEENACVYNIHYCKAGVGFQFYEGNLEDDLYADKWREHLNTHQYYPTFEEAVDGEYIRLTKK